jgi:hypothetical protein
MARMATFFSPSCPKDVLQLNLWWQMEYQGLYFRIIIIKAFILYKKKFEIFTRHLGLGRNDFLRWEDT